MTRGEAPGQARVDGLVNDPSILPGNGHLKLPGFGLPVDYRSDDKEAFLGVFAQDSTSKYGPVIGSAWKAATLLIREACMLRLMEELTNKPEWWIKVHDDEIANRWKAEALQFDWEEVLDYADFVPAMADACISELRRKASFYEQTSLLPVLDYSLCIIKSDRLITPELKAALKAAVKPLEDVPDDRKDWHPGTLEQVLDLVHPSMWPLVYGRSHIVPDRRIGVDECLQYCGVGTPIPFVGSGPGRRERVPVSREFQWLPCDASIRANGSVKIDSYINNAHPVHQADLYPVVEKFIERSLPAWDLVHRWPTEFSTQRLKSSNCNPICTTEEICKHYCQPWNRPVSEGEEERRWEELDDPGYHDSERARLDDEWFCATHKMDLPEPDPTDASCFRAKADDIRSSGFFGGASRIQVIVKLANIHLTPEKPEYDGGSWHVEGLLNEHICATALFYYDSDNITESSLDLRVSADREELVRNSSYAQNDELSINRVFAIDAGGDTIQDIGNVLTREDRAVFFPNLVQHRVSPFRLADDSRPGHRKILALFLVDPATPIISTAHVPPQQRSWWEEEVRPGEGATSILPAELRDMILANMDVPFDEDEARRIRKQMMRERSFKNVDLNRTWKRARWNFCEH